MLQQTKDQEQKMVDIGMVQIGKSGLWVDIRDFVDNGYGRVFLKAKIMRKAPTWMDSPVEYVVIHKLDGISVSRASYECCSPIHFEGVNVLQFMDSISLQAVASDTDVIGWADHVRKVMSFERD